MIEFAVSIEGITEEGRALWVLAVDPAGERLLVAHADGTLHWHPQAACVFAKLMNPEAPRAVIPMQPKPQIVAPNRAIRRELERNGA